MNYQPFSVLGKGNFFNLVSRPDVALMKTGPNSAVYLQGFWAGPVLHPRGEQVRMDNDTCVIIPEISELILQVANADPIDPRRKFWKDGDQVKVGRNQAGAVNIFAGLFVYHGMGSGNYYSSAGNEIFGGDRSWAMERAANEGLPFVYHDCFELPDDVGLTRARARALVHFEEAKAAAVSTA